MSGLPWFRMYADFITDPEVEELSFEDQRHFVFVLCMKCNGMLDKDFATDEARERAVARRLGLHGEAFTFAKQRLVESGLVDDDWQPRSWDKLQKPSDSAAERMRRYRERQRNESLRNGDGADKNRTDTDTEKKEDARAREDRFDEFWTLYPKRVGKAAAKRVWSRKGLNAKADEILDHLRARVRSDAQWLAEGGKFIPHPSTWLNRDGWDDEYQMGDANGTGRQGRKPSAVERAQRATGGGF